MIYKQDYRTQLEKCLRLIQVRFVEEDAENAEGDRVGVLRNVPVNTVLAAEARDNQRLDRYRLALSSGAGIPPIRVIGLRCKGRRTLYGIIKGAHRTIAAREAGRRTIRAEVWGWSEADPSLFVIHRACLYNATSHFNLLPVRHDLTPATVAGLVDLGVFLFPDDVGSSLVCVRTPIGTCRKVPG